MIGTLYQRVCPDCEGLFEYTPRPDGGGVSPRCDPCRPCNSSKGSMTTEEYMMRKGDRLWLR